MTKKILSVLLSIFVIATLFTGCGSQKVDNTDTVDLIGKDETAEETNYVTSITDNVSDTAEEQSIDNIYNDNAVNSTTEESIDYEILGIKKYEYPLEFSIGDNLKTAITQLALSYDDFDKDSVSSGDWKEIFVARFIQNSRVSFDYLDMISDKNNGHIQADELNYIQFSLTNIELDFSSYVDGSINRMDSASPLNYGWISEYVYEYTDNGVIVTADFEVGTDGTDATQKRCITVELVKNPYSCFDGYSIVAISSKTASPCSEEQGEAVSDKVQAGLYEGEYCDYDANEPSLEIKKNDDET